MSNVADKNAVAVYKEDIVVGHVPSKFSEERTNKAFAKVIGERVNRGVGYGLEIPCIYFLYRPKPEKMKELVESLSSTQA